MDLNRRALGGGLLASLALSVKRAFGAQAPSGQVISFQGRLTDAGGVALPDGTHSMTLVLYDNGIPTGFTETQSVVVKDGVFSAWLGEQATLPRFDPTHDYGVGVSVDGGGELLPRQRLGAVPIAQTATYGSVPIGGIIPYWGNSASIPFGWKLCDGTVIDVAGSPLNPQTAPNLVGKFVRGATGDVRGSPVTGGNDAIDLQHLHSTGDFTLGLNHIPSHSHSDTGHSHAATTQIKGKATPGNTFEEPQGGTNGGGAWSIWNVQVDTGHASLSNTGGGQPHNHGNTGQSLSTSQSIVPNYIGLLYIMRVL